LLNMGSYGEPPPKGHSLLSFQAYDDDDDDDDESAPPLNDDD
jgi:hypothetical protein